jgi:lactate dehydrogenase-like 2-hydroxyacid dehydrogenase/DNA-binding beta-propeller fold protein YncE
MKKLVVYRELPEPLLASLRQRFDVTYFENIDAGNYAAFAAAVVDAHGLLGSNVTIDRALLEPARALEAVSTISVGYDNFDVDFLTERGIVLAHTPDVLNETTADTVFALILASARRLVELAEFVKAGEWTRSIGPAEYGVNVHSKTLGIIGMGRIGQAVARRARLGFGMTVLYHNRNSVPAAEAEFGARRLPLDDLLAQADFVCVMLPLNPATEKLIGAREFALMKPSAIFINAARGRVIDEAALIEALRNGTIHAAGLDVFEREPLPADSPLPAMKNVVALPHIGSATHETRYDMSRMAVDNIVAALDGKPQNVVNRVVAGALALAFGAVAVMQPSAPAVAADLIVSANDAKYVRVEGKDTYPESVGRDTLTLIDASSSPPRVQATIEVQHTLAGPPQAVAITPNGRLAIVSAPNRYDRAEQKVVLENFLQVVDLAASPPRVIEKIDVGSHPQGLAINRDGTLLLAATVAGTVAVLGIDTSKVSLREQLKISDRRLAGVSFTHDGRAALVALRDEQGVVVLDVNDGKVTTARDRVSTGVGPYAVDVSSDGRWAVVGNVGLAGLANPGRLYADADTFTLIDVSRRPFRAVQHVTVPAVPEGVALSPDGRWIAVQAMDGSNLPTDNSGRKPRGRVLLFEIRNGEAVRTANLPGGEAGQGIVFSADSKTILVQFNVEKQIAVYAVNGGTLKDTGQRIPVSGGPASLRSMPR